jgi:hypothetical protein
VKVCETNGGEEAYLVADALNGAKQSPVQNFYILVEIKPLNILRHGGPRDHRQVALYVNGRRFKEWHEDSAPHYNSGRHFDAEVARKVKKIRKFWPGSLIKGARPDWEDFPKTMDEDDLTIEEETDGRNS